MLETQTIKHLYKFKHVKTVLQEHDSTIMEKNGSTHALLLQVQSCAKFQRISSPLGRYFY